MPCVQVDASPGRGNILRCRSDVVAGQTLLIEEPIFLTGAGYANGKEIAMVYKDFCSLPEKTQQIIMEDFWCPMESQNAKRVEGEVSKLYQDGKIIDRIVRLLTIMHFNAVQACEAKEDGSGKEPAHEGRLALYLVACKAAHSCAPNACWYTRDAGGSRVMRSLVPISSGEEVFISYLGDEDMLLGKDERQAMLSQTKEFRCACLRCASDEEDTRVFNCPEPGCFGKRLLVAGSVGPCNRCVASLPAATNTNMLAKEKAVRQKMDYIDDVINTRKPIDVSKEVFNLSLGPLHAHHSLSCRHAQAQYDFFNAVSNFVDAAKALQRHVARWEVVPLTKGAAFDFEFLGKAFLLANDAASACSSYERTCAVLAVVHERFHPYVLCAARKLAKARMEIPANESANPEDMQGKSVLLRGLQQKTLNGAVGKCGDYKQGRLEVELPGARVIRIKAANLQVLHESTLKTGDIVVVFGLTSQAGTALNGLVGSVGARADERWAVQIEGHGVKSVRPDNLGSLTHSLASFEM
eukprot:TRINITY_DN49277_c0_g1_i1.p1 TRINITY_DN49277_c0_g1~~TRINITY_DN49277_c0_g1_i1.p1  ORF type:complete len:523 (-),score=56.69 TRINITY_DN49277_c0_g1_i1:525-2093(-)